MAGDRHQSMEYIREHIQYVKDMIERCIQCYMSRREAAQYLETHFQIKSEITESIWKSLEEENEDFFEWYRVRYLLNKQIKQFNSLLRSQIKLIEEMHAGAASQDHTQPSSSTAPSGSEQVVKSVLQDHTQAGSSNAASGCEQDMKPISKDPEALLQLDLNIEPRGSEQDMKPISEEPEAPLQLDLNIEPRGSEQGMQPISEEREAPLQLNLNIEPPTKAMTGI